MRNIFLKNSCWECGRKTNPRPFFRKSNLSISLDQEFHSLFLLYAQVEHYQNIETTSCKAFSKNKKRSGISLLLHFLHGFWRKFSLSLISINYCLIAFTFRYIWQYVHCSCLCSSVWRQKFWIYPSFLIMLFSYIIKKKNRT